MESHLQRGEECKELSPSRVGFKQKINVSSLPFLTISPRKWFASTPFTLFIIFISSLRCGEKSWMKSSQRGVESATIRRCLHCGMPRMQQPVCSFRDNTAPTRRTKGKELTREKWESKNRHLSLSQLWSERRKELWKGKVDAFTHATSAMWAEQRESRRDKKDEKRDFFLPPNKTILSWAKNSFAAKRKDSPPLSAPNGKSFFIKFTGTAESFRFLVVALGEVHLHD